MTYDEQHAAIKADLLGKVERADWHGVSDAANDLRVLEATRPVVERPEMCVHFYKDGNGLKHGCTFSYGHSGHCLFT